MKILIDNGHGVETPGKRSPDGLFFEYASNVLSGFLNDDLAMKVRQNKHLMIMGGSDMIDEEYEKDYKLPVEKPLVS